MKYQYKRFIYDGYFEGFPDKVVYRLIAKDKDDALRMVKRFIKDDHPLKFIGDLEPVIYEKYLKQIKL